jgi:hypothetical protein
LLTAPTPPDGDGLRPIGRAGPWEGRCIIPRELANLREKAKLGVIEVSKGVVAVDDRLGELGQILMAEGYQVVDLAGDLGQVDAVITSGLSQNIMGIQTTSTRAPILNGAGRSPDEILADLERRLKGR